MHAFNRSCLKFALFAGICMWKPFERVCASQSAVRRAATCALVAKRLPYRAAPPIPPCARARDVLRAVPSGRCSFATWCGPCARRGICRGRGRSCRSSTATVAAFRACKPRPTLPSCRVMLCFTKLAALFSCSLDDVAVHDTSPSCNNWFQKAI